MSDLGFRYQLRKNGDVVITHKGTQATTLRSDKADAFRQDANELSEDDLQQEMARLTGNYRHGNERVAKMHPRNR